MCVTCHCDNLTLRNVEVRCVFDMSSLHRSVIILRAAINTVKIGSDELNYIGFKLLCYKEFYKTAQVHNICYLYTCISYVCISKDNFSISCTVLELLNVGYLFLRNVNSVRKYNMFKC